MGCRNVWDERRSYQRVAIEGVEVAVRLGAYPEERAGPQPVRVDVELFRHSHGFDGGGLDACLNYDRIHGYLVEQLPARQHTDLLEELIEDLVRFCLEDRRVEACRVTIRKPAVYKGIGWPAVEIYRRRSDV